MRPYNATSARTLACFLASQDNPEKGLCQYGAIPQSKAPAHTRLRVSSKNSISMDGAKSVQWNARSPRSSAQILSSVTGSGQTSPAGFEGTLPRARHAIPNISREESSKNEEDADLEHVRSVVRALEEPVKSDHKSFIQNLFGTVAFRMLEWITPKNLESMISSDARTHDVSPGKPGSNIDESSKPQSSAAPGTESPSNKETFPVVEHPSKESQKQSQQNPNPESVPDSVTHFPCSLDGHAGECDSRKEDETTKQNPSLATHSRRCSHDITDATAQPSPTKLMNGAVLHDIPDRSALELGLQRSTHKNSQTVQPEDAEHQKSTDNQGKSPIKKGRPRPSSLSSSRPISYGESFSHHSGSQHAAPQSAKRVSIDKSLPSISDNDVKRADGEERHDIRFEQQRRNPSTFHPSMAKGRKSSPQSLSVLSLEVIDFIGRFLQENEAADRNAAFTQSPYPNDGLRRARKTEGPHKTEIHGEILIQPLPVMTPIWTSFINQSLFYVLSSPKALLQSFSGGAQSLLDTQTLWYCMMCLVRANSSLVFESLWIAAADLYVPPRELWPIYDWAKKPQLYKAGGSVDYTPDEAARLMSICLHALIAAVPYTGDPGQLFAMSRIRSYGVSSIQRRGVSAESVNLYLTMDDVFSDELNLRLARRLFAAIPARRQYQELLKLNENGNVARSSIPDILDLVLAPLNFLDIEVPPILDFAQGDRALHEKRAPILMIDWARTVMLQDWTGSAEVSADGAFGGALAMISAICKLHLVSSNGVGSLITNIFKMTSANHCR
jgi:hypothetical protein